jgi:hypothetical protein
MTALSTTFGLAEEELELVLGDLFIAYSGCWLRASRADPRWRYDVLLIRVTPEGRKVACPLHRAAYEHWVGPIPPGLQLDHVWEWGCRFRGCFLPDHLEPVTRSENIKRGHRVRRARLLDARLSSDRNLL